MRTESNPIDEDGVLRAPQGPSGHGIDRGRLEEALASANLPTLEMVLFQLTGEERWLEDPFRPTPTRGLSPHDLGGFREDVAADLRTAAADAICAWADGAPVAVPTPDTETLRRMMSVYVGEDVPEEYERLVRHEMGFHVAERPSPPAPEGALSAIVVGAGISGMLAAVRLRDAGISCTVLERNHDVGGVWLTNDYPGAGVDTPSFLYSYSFFPRRWSTHFGKRGEMATYARELADAFDLRRDIRFGVNVERLVYDEDAQEWTVTARSAAGALEELKARVVISAVGTFNTPSRPSLPGLDSFMGRVVHSAEWPADLDLEGERVAVIGAGASGQQIVPAIAGDVAALHVYQRSPQWIAPNAEYFAPVGKAVHWLMENVPYYHAWYRARLAWIFNDRIHASLQIDPAWPHPERSLNATNEGHRNFFVRYLTEQLEGREDLIDKSLPGYPPFGKRMLLDNGWYRTLLRENVELVTDPIEAVTPTGIRAGGTERDVDVIVLATGFVARRYLPFDEVRGRGGRRIRDEWGDEDARAFLGMTVPGYPNLFIMYGPNTNAGAGGSVIFIAECQCDHIMQLVGRMASGEAGAVESRPESLQRWIDSVDAAHERMVWSHPGMSTYYRNRAGRVVTNSPWRIVDYWTMTREVDPQDYTFEPPRVSEES